MEQITIFFIVSCVALALSIAAIFIALAVRVAMQNPDEDIPTEQVDIARQVGVIRGSKRMQQYRSAAKGGSVVTALLLSLVLFSGSGCAPGTPLQVLGDPKAAPLDRIAAAENLHNSAMTVILILHQDKKISDASFHQAVVASDAFMAAINSLRSSSATGTGIDGNTLWTAANSALARILDEKAKAGK